MYRQIVEDEILSRNVDIAFIERAITKLKSTHRRIFLQNELPEIDYDDEEYRYGYISLCAESCTELVKECVREVASISLPHFARMMKYDQRDFRVCSLGGGPGCDVFGLLMARLERGEFGRVRICVFDVYQGWEATLHRATASFSRIYSRPVEGYFLRTDLRGDIFQQPNAVNEMRNCDILNLVKFDSASSNPYYRSPKQLEAIFRIMKPGACVFFLHNSRGGFYEMVSEAAIRAHLQLAIPPKTSNYRTEENYPNTGLFNDTSLPSMLVSSYDFALWVKPMHRA